MDKFLEFLGLGNLTGEQMEAMRPLMIIVAVLLLIAFILLFDRVENARFRRWYNRNSTLDTPIKPWRTIIPWHKTGSKWYLNRQETPSPNLNRKVDRVRYPNGKLSGNSFAIHRAKHSGGGNIGDGSGNSIGR